MRKTLKVFAAVLGLTIVLIGVAAGILPLVVDPNQFKAQLAETIKEKTGFEAEFIGDLHLSVFPWLGISAGRIRINSGQGFQAAEFLSIEQGDIKVNLLPLIVKKLEINRIDLKGLRINLLRTPEGGNNWSPIAAQSTGKDESITPDNKNQKSPLSSESTWPFFAVGRVSLEDAAIHWDDRQNDKRLDIDNISLNIDAFAWNQLTDVALKLSIAQPDGNQDIIDFKTRVLIRPNLEQADLVDTEMDITRKGKSVSGKAMSVKLTAPEIIFEKGTQKFQIAELKIQSGELSIVSRLTGNNLFNGADVEGAVQIAEFNPGKLLKGYAIELPKFQSPDAFSRLEADFNLHATKNSVFVQGLRCKLDDTLLQGDVGIEGMEAPAIRFNLAVDAVDADRYLPPDSKKTKLVSPAAAIAVAFSKLPLAQLKKLDAQGEVILQHLKLQGIIANDLKMELSARDGLVESRQIISRLYQGDYEGSVNWNAKDSIPMLSMSEKIRHVDIEPFLKVMGSKISITGALTGSTTLQGEGHDPKQFRQKLKGNLFFALKDGAIRELKFQKIIDQAMETLSQTPLPPNQRAGIDFSEITGTAVLADNVIRNQDLLVKSSRFRIAGSGMANIETGMVDYRFVANLVKAPATVTEPEKFHSTPIVVNMSGTLAEPDYRLDMAGLLTDKNKAKIEKFFDKNKDKMNRLKEKLNKKLGPGVGDLLNQFF